MWCCWWGVVGRPCGGVRVMCLAPMLWCWFAVVGRPRGGAGMLWLGSHVVVLVCSGWASTWWCWCAVI